MTDQQTGLPTLLTLRGDALAKDRKQVFMDDADWRTKCLALSGNVAGQKGDGFSEALRLYGATSYDQLDKGVPQFQMIREATDEYATYALGSVPGGRIVVDPKPDAADEFEREVRAKEARETEMRLNACVETKLRQEQWADLKEKATRVSAIAGVGYVGGIEEKVLDRKYRDVRALMRKFRDKGRPFTVKDERAMKKAARRLRLKNIDPRKVYWEAGVASVYGTDYGKEMLRVSVHEEKNTESLKAVYRGKKVVYDDGSEEEIDVSRIKAGTDVYGLTADTYQPIKSDAQLQRTGLVTTWEIVEVPQEMSRTEWEVRPDGSLGQRVIRFEEMDRRMIRTVIAGDVLVEREVWNADEGSVMLPIIPFYLREDQDHPYGNALPLILKMSQDFINRIRVMIYKQGMNSFSNQAVAILGDRLGGEDNVKEIIEAFRKGEPMIIEGNPAGRPIQSIHDIIAPLATATAPLAPALVELLKLELENFQRSSLMTDRAAMRSARSAKAKNAETAAADRPKGIMLGMQSRSVEELYSFVCEDVVRDKDEREVPGPNGLVRLNEKGTERIPRPDPATGGPMRLPPEMLPMAQQAGMPVDQDGSVYRDVPVVYGDTDAMWSAQADSRDWLPADKMQRLQVLAALAEAEVIQSRRTIRDEVLPEQMRARDDANSAEEQEQMQQQLAMQQQQLQQQQAAEMLQAAQQMPEGSPERMGQVLASLMPAGPQGGEPVMA